jgi:hypothetical protein
MGKDIVNICTIDGCAAKIQSAIIKAYEKSCLLKTASGVQNGAENLRKRARKAWNYHLTDPDAYRNSIKEYTKILRSKKRSSFTSTDQEVAEHLFETHFPGCQPISEPQSQSQPMSPSTEDWYRL